MKTMINIRLLAIALTALFTTAFISPALANDEKKAIPVELKFVGNVKDQPVFHLVFDGTEENEFIIAISDESGNVLYKEIIKGTKFLKKFRINTDEVDNGKLKFAVSSKSFDKPVVFEVNNQSRFVEEVVVSKIK